jgi:anaerobic selenocysteine-containing dehydrogenase
MNPEDAVSIGISNHQLVIVRGDAGQLSNVEVIYGKIRRGAAMMFYPEVNAIFQAHNDPRSGTPAFKRVPVVVYAAV